MMHDPVPVDPQLIIGAMLLYWPFGEDPPAFIKAMWVPWVCRALAPDRGGEHQRGTR